MRDLLFRIRLWWSLRKWRVFLRDAQKADKYSVLIEYDKPSVRYYVNGVLVSEFDA